MIDASEIVTAVTGVTKKWTKQRKAEEREANRVHNRRYVMARSSRVTIKEVAWAVMEEAYLKASSNGQYPAHARQIMYAARPQILARADTDALDDGYFTQTLLPNFMQEHPGLTADWDVVFDARGHLYEPHTKQKIPLGTLDVRRYLSEIDAFVDGEIPVTGKDSRLRTVGPANRYGAILFIEKEGFMPLFQKAKLAERYDIAIMSTKGMSTTASRDLVDTLCDADVPLLVLHDFDKVGFSILGTLQRDTRRYTFSNRANVIELGIRLDDIRAYELQAETCTLGKSNPTRNLRENGATDEEIDFLCAGHSYHGYTGQRIELNAFTSGDFLQWIEGKLEAHCISKVIPDGETLKTAYRRARLAHIVDEHLESIVEMAKKEVDGINLDANEIRRYIEKSLRDRPYMPWDDAITDMAGGDA